MQLEGLGSAVSSPSGVWAKPQPTKDLVHIQGQNNSFMSNIALHMLCQSGVDISLNNKGSELTPS